MERIPRSLRLFVKRGAAIVPAVLMSRIVIAESLGRITRPIDTTPGNRNRDSLALVFFRHPITQSFNRIIEFQK